MSKSTKSNIVISITGQCSESRNDIAEAIKQLMLSRGYGKVSISGEDNKCPWDGLSMDESIEIRC
jgi:hypothetical protein